MKINTETMVSITEANQNFSKISRLVDEKGLALVLKNNSPKYVILDYTLFEKLQSAEDDLIENVAEMVLAENMEAFRELAK